ncbi:MAG: hypothetical protein D6746_01375 [Bacteroidetes bacterium]|nr:MAG: hypothetical protein D6746_01375 [Bacteroidota bacterium]
MAICVAEPTGQMCPHGGQQHPGRRRSCARRVLGTPEGETVQGLMNLPLGKPVPGEVIDEELERDSGVPGGKVRVRSVFHGAVGAVCF